MHLVLAEVAIFLICFTVGFAIGYYIVERMVAKLEKQRLMASRKSKKK